MKKAVVLVIVWGITIVLCFLAMAAIYLMGNQAFIAEHKTKRMMAYYTARSGLYHALEAVRAGNTTPGPVTLSHGNPASTVDLQANISVSPINATTGLRTIIANVTY
ncbi:hypothetical protein ACFL5X_04095 [Candidatus Omnitrophota bacterium]